MKKLLLRIDEVGFLLSVSKRTVYRMISSGQIPALKVGQTLRVQVKDIDVYLKRQANSFLYENG